MDNFSLEEAEQGNFSAFGDIIKGDKGDPGAVFTPAVDSDGNISWTNDGGLPNPETQNIKGPQGDPGNYTKPATGIPKTDLAEDVQTSLGKADAALPASGGTMSGAIAMGGNKITGLAGGTSASDAVTKAQLDAAVVGALKPSGSIAFASLPTLSASVLNNIYNITDAFTTTSDFVEGSGKSYPAGTNVAVINTGTAADPVYKFDVYTGVIDLSAYRTAADQDVIDAGKLGTGGDGSNVTAAFSAASSRTNIATGEKLSVIFGKITKWFSDLGTAAFRAATNAITQGSTDLIESGAVYTGLTGKYSKPAGGIPESDLSQDVQEKLNSGTSDALPLAGGTMSGAINMDGNKVSNLPTPTASGDAVPKDYADGLVNGYRTAAAQDLIDAGKAPLASPTFTGTPTAPTAAQGANSQQIATTAYADAALSNFAYVNSGDTADKAYTIDELLVYKGQLYKASAAIAIGETLTPDSNITLRTIATALQNLHLKYTSLFDGGITAYTNYTLSDSLANYDIVIAEIYTQDNERKAYFLLPVLNKKYDISWNATDSLSWYIICTIRFTANTTLNVLKCSKRGFSQSNLQIYGIRIV